MAWLRIKTFLRNLDDITGIALSKDAKKIEAFHKGAPSTLLYEGDDAETQFYRLAADLGAVGRDNFR